jgi:hypothetical protein
MAPQPRAPAPQPPPDVPSMPDVDSTLVNYLRTFALWCRNGFASKLDNSSALPGVLLQAQAAVSNPPVFMLQVTGTGTATMAPVALGTGDSGTPVEIGSHITSQLAIRANPADPGGYAYVGFYDAANTRHGWVGYRGAGAGNPGVALTNDLGASINLGDNGTISFVGTASFSGNLTASSIHATAGFISNANGIIFTNFYNRYVAFGWDNNGMKMQVDGGSDVGYAIRGAALGIAGTPLTQIAFDGNTSAVYANWPGGTNIHWLITWGLTADSLRSNRAAPRDALYVLEQIPVRQVEVDLPLRDDPLGLDFAILPDDLRDLLPEAIEGDGVRLDPLVGLLIRAVQQLTERLEALEAAR